MKNLLFIVTSLFILSACHESLEDRAAREAKEYTEHYCPTPYINHTRTDSVTFNKATKTYTYYCAFSDMFDDQNTINNNRLKIHSDLLQSIKDNTQIKKLKEANFNFAYIVHSTKDPKQVLYQDKFTYKDYN